MTGDIELMAQALSDCIGALEDEGHSDEMAASLCEQGDECWKCEAVKSARAAIATIRRD